jgi:hypothetical protein
MLSTPPRTETLWRQSPDDVSVLVTYVAIAAAVRFSDVSSSAYLLSLAGA